LNYTRQRRGILSCPRTSAGGSRAKGKLGHCAARPGKAGLAGRRLDALQKVRGRRPRSRGVAVALNRPARVDASAFNLREASLVVVDAALTDAASKKHTTPDNSLLA